MPGLVLSLKADEKFLVNGALLQNGPKRGQIHLPDNSVYVLRLSDCLHPDDIHTPVQRAYYQVQLILSGDTSHSTGTLDLFVSLSGLDKVFKGTRIETQISKAVTAASLGRYYSVLVTLKRILSLEQTMLAHVNLGVQDTLLEKMG
jgi:flagellar protein FlbT